GLYLEVILVNVSSLFKSIHLLSHDDSWLQDDEIMEVCAKGVLASGWGVEGFLSSNAIVINDNTILDDADLGCSSVEVDDGDGCYGIIPKF
nr:hypothetical protein [Tanacetum cinerariifolium]